MGAAPRVGLGERAHRQQHPAHHAAVDAPQKIALVLGAIGAAQELALVHARVVARRDPVALERIRLAEQVAELGERVAAHAGNGRATRRVFAHEVLDHVAAERALEVEHVVRDADALADAARIVDRAARTVWHVVAVTEELHRRADYLVALLGERGRGDGRVDTTRHGREDAAASLRHQATAPVNRRALATSAGKSSAMRSMHSSVVRAPRLMRTADTARSRGTPNAARTCDGSTLPLVHAEPDEHATPARSRAMSMDSLSVPGTDTLKMCGARGPPPPFTTASGMRARSVRSRRSRSAPNRRISASRSAMASSAARARPIAAATFSVPGRNPRFCEPPWSSGSHG